MKRFTQCLVWTVILSVAGLVPAAFAQAPKQDPRVAELIEKMTAQIEQAKTSYTEMNIMIDAPGMPMPPFMANGLSTHMWRDGDDIRLELPHMNMVVIVTSKEMVMYQGMFGAALHVGPKAMAQVKAKQADALAKLGLPQDQDRIFIALLEQGGASVVGEEMIDGVECLVLNIPA